MLEGQLVYLLIYWHINLLGLFDVISILLEVTI